MAAKADRYMPDIFERVTIFTTKPVIGQYRFSDRFQIYPSRRKPVRNGRLFYPLTIEMSFPKQDEPYYRYSSGGNDELTRRIVELQHLLSVVTQFFFFGHVKAKSPIKRFTNRSCDPIETGQIRWYQDKVLDDRNVEHFAVPDHMGIVLDAYYALPRARLLTFRKACYLFYCGVELRGAYPTLSFASFVSAIETLMAFDGGPPDRCECCKQLRYRLSARFKKFVLTYGYGGKDDAGAKKFAKALYDQRSKILHEGKLLLADMSWHVMEGERAGVNWEESFLHKDLLAVTRVCLLNWLASEKS